jgi:hypothetical protein
MNNDKEIKQEEVVKKTWSKPVLYSGKGIEFFGLGRAQYSTGPGGTGS